LRVDLRARERGNLRDSENTRTKSRQSTFYSHLSPTRVASLAPNPRPRWFVSRPSSIRPRAFTRIASRTLAEICPDQNARERNIFSSVTPPASHPTRARHSHTAPDAAVDRRSRAIARDRPRAVRSTRHRRAHRAPTREPPRARADISPSRACARIEARDASHRARAP